VEGDTSLMVGPDCAAAGVTNRTASRQNIPVEAFIIRYTVCDSSAVDLKFLSLCRTLV
jgi:hypothetical protein